jgi:hypothetical protein
MYDKVGIMGGSWWWSVDLCACTIPSVDTDRRIRNYAVTTAISALISTLPPNYVLFDVVVIRLRIMASPMPGFRHVSVFTRWSYDTYAQPPTRRARVSLFVRYVAQILSGVDLPSSKALSVLAFSSPPVHASSLARINVPSTRWEIPLRETPTTLPRIAQD